MNGKKNFYILIDLLILVLLIVCYNMKIDMKEYSTLIMITGYIVIFLFILFIIQLYKIKKNIMSFCIIFFVFLFLFNFGQVLLYTLSVDSKQLYLFQVCTLEQIYDASVFFLFSMILYHIGSLFALCSTDVKYNLIENKPSSQMIKSIKIFGIILFLISFIPYNYSLIQKFVESMKYGYSYLYSENASSLPNTIGYLSNFFIPSIFLLLFCSKSKKINAFLIFYLMVVISINLLIGARGNAFTIIVMLIVFNYNFVKKINKKQIIKISIIIILTTILIPVIGGFRSAASKNMNTLSEIFQNVINNKDSNFVVKTIAELGGSMHPYILTKSIIPSVYDYKYGESYFYSILMIIPSKLLGGTSYAAKAALDIWLQDTLRMSYGPGYSIFAETYYNFGYVYGIAFTLILGLFFTKMFDLSSKNIDKFFLLKLLSLIFLYNSLILGRFPFHSTIRNIVYLFLIPYILIIIIYNRMNKYKMNKIII